MSEARFCNEVKNRRKLDSERSEHKATSPLYLAATSLETFCFY